MSIYWAELFSERRSQPSAPGTRDPGLWPFAATSPWNYPIGSNAQYAGFQWRNYSEQGIPDSLGLDPNVCAVFIAQPTDPLTTFINLGWGNEVWQRRLPASASTAGAESFLALIDESHLSALDLYSARRQSDGSWTATGGLWNVDLKGPGYGLYGPMCLNPPGGDGSTCHGQTRAAGVPTFAGAVRPGELANGINHALAINTGYDFLSAAPGGRGYVWPASGADGDWATTYTGASIMNLYMGSLVAIPLSVDINALGLVLPQSVNIARALQRYGAYTVDRDGTGVMGLIFDSQTYSEWLAWANDPNYQSDRKKIGEACRIVQNSYAPNGTQPVGGVKLHGGDGVLSAPVAPAFDR